MVYANEFQEAFVKDTNKDPYTMYCHVFGPSDAYVAWLESRLKSKESSATPSNTPCTPCPECGRPMRMVCWTVGCDNSEY
jgi:hypothetical protein